MLRPLLVFGALVLAVQLVASTVAEVGGDLQELQVYNEPPWKLWRWDGRMPTNPFENPTGCKEKEFSTENTITQWPRSIEKDQPFTVGGVVIERGEGRGVIGMPVQVFINKTKDTPGTSIGETRTDADGRYALTTTFPASLPPEKYQLVSFAKPHKHECKKYEQSWSDPEVRVMAETTIDLRTGTRYILQAPGSIEGAVLDVTGVGVPNAPVTLRAEGKTFTIRTDESGAFLYNFTPSDVGILPITAEFGGNEFYRASRGATNVTVIEEDFVLDAGPGGATIPLARSQATSLSGQVFVAPSRLQSGPLRLTFGGFRVAACPTCPVSEAITASVDAQGRFTATVYIPKETSPATGSFAITGAGLKRDYGYNAEVRVPTTIDVEATSPGWILPAIRSEVRLTDDRGEPVSGSVEIVSGASQSAGVTRKNGVAEIRMPLGCGEQPVTARFGPEGPYLPSSKTANVRVCPALAFVPAWIFDVPLWAWCLVAAALVGLALAGRRAYRRYAYLLVKGPPLRLAVTEPRDDVRDVVAVGDTIVVTAFFDDPLPEGARAFLGSAKEMRERSPGPDLRASVEHVPDRTGAVSFFAEIVDRKGRTVQRRVLSVRVVRYAEEIERRYRALKRRRVGRGADRVSPREFERFIARELPTLDPRAARRLVALFEEADYGPRDVSRPDFLAYVRAESRLTEVTPVADA